MPLYHILVDVGAPAGLGGHDQVAVLYARRLGDEIVLPGHVIDVDLHDAEFGIAAQKWALISVDRWP